MSMIVGNLKKKKEKLKRYTVDDQATNHERTQHILDVSAPIHLYESDYF